MRPRVALLLAVLLVPFAFVGGMVLGGHPSVLPGWLADAVADHDDTRFVNEALETIADEYYRPVSERQLADEALSGAVESLDDRFSAYLSPEEFRAFQRAQDAEFSGIGVAVQGVERGLRVLEVYPDSPASDAGLRERDVIVAADGKRLAGLTEQAAAGRVKGPEGTKVRLRIRRGEETLSKTLTRRTVDIPVVTYELRRVEGEKLAVISLRAFTSGVHGELSAALRRAKREGAEGVVLDLTGNGGGLVEEARLVASAFLREGEIVTTRGRSVPERTLDATGDPVAPDLPVVVLTDRGTASAAEIVAGALQDRDRATVVGTRTFGKGVFQELIQLPNGGALDITAGQYFTPSGSNLGGKGVKTGSGIAPDVRVADDPDTERDEALQRALELLARKVS